MKKRILVIIKHIDGGTGIFLNKISKLALDKKHNFSISLIALEREKFINPGAFNSITYYPRSKSNLRYLFTISHIIDTLEEFYWLKKEVNKHNPAVILSIDPRSNFYSLLLKKLFFRKVRLIITNHNNIEAIYKEKLSPIIRVILRYLGKLLLPIADEIVCISKPLSESYSKFFSLKKSIKTIPYGINLLQAKRLAKEPIDSKDKKYFLNGKKTLIAVGRLAIQKDFETLIKAFKIISLTMPKTQLIILGDGPEKEKLNILIREIKLEKKVFLLGWKKNVHPYLVKSHIFILSSIYEGFGYVILEAMSQEIPVISTNAPFGPKEILSNGRYGIITPVKDSRKVAGSVISILKNNNKYKQYSINSKKRVSKYSEASMLKEYEKIFNNLITY